MPSAYTYLRELQKKKSSDVLRFLARIRMWQARMEPNIKKLTRPSRTEKARGLGYKRIPGMSIVRCAVRRGGRKRPNSKGIVYGKPKHHGIHKVKAVRNLKSMAEARVVSSNCFYYFFEFVAWHWPSLCHFNNQFSLC